MRINHKLSGGVLAGALALATACGANGSTTGNEAMTSGSAPAAATAPTTTAEQTSATFNDADVMFAQMMIPHHEQAIEMADLAPARAADPEIKKLATEIKAAQGPEIQTMKGWLSEWGKPAPEGGMGHDMPGIMSDKDMTRLEAAKGKTFDKLFAQLMIAHHNGAIQMARTEQAGGSNPEAKELASTIEATQQAEVKQFRQILDRL